MKKRKPSIVVHLPVGRVIPIQGEQHTIATYACRPNVGIKNLPPLPDDTSDLRRCKACEKAITKTLQSLV